MGQKNATSVYEKYQVVYSRNSRKMLILVIFAVVFLLLFIVGAAVLAAGLAVNTRYLLCVGTILMAIGFIAFMKVDGILFEVSNERKMKALLMELLEAQAKLNQDASAKTN